MINKKYPLIVGLSLLTAVTCDAQLLWRISGEDLPRDSFLFGTYHLGSVEFCDGIVGFNEAMSSVEQAYFEVNFQDGIPAADPRFSPFMPEGKSMSVLYDKQEMEEVLDYVARVTGKRYGRVTFTPKGLHNFLVLSLYGKAFPEQPFREDNAMDIALQKRAATLGLPVYGLESYEFQMNVLYGDSLEEQAASLLEWIRSPESDPDEVVENIRALVNAYQGQDLVELEQVPGFDQPTPFTKQLLDDRNEKWVPKMMDAAKNHPTFFAVGAGHLVGNNGLISLLRKQGYHLTPVK